MMSVLHRYFCSRNWRLPFAFPALAQDQIITLHKVLIDQVSGEDWFRFIAPSISADGSDVKYDYTVRDIEHLCATVAVPYIAEYELVSNLIVLSLADQKIEFGETNPDVAQFF